MDRRKVIFVSIGIALCGLIAGIAFSRIQNSKSISLYKKADEQRQYLMSNSDVGVSQDIGEITSTISSGLSAAHRILDLKHMTSKEKAMSLYNTYATTTLSVKKRGFIIESQLADTLDLHMLGLSGRAGLSKRSGLLFVFTQDGYYPFWMKDMLFPIDIIWINQDKEIVHIEHSVSPDTYPRSFASPELARYVLEITAHLAKEVGLEKGDIVDF